MGSSSTCSDYLKGYEDLTRHVLGAVEEILEIKAGQKPPRANTNWRAISVFDVCAEVWETRTRDPAPTLGAHTEETSKFGKFVGAVFKELGIGCSPRVAQNGLARWRSENYELHEILSDIQIQVTRYS